MTTRQKIALLLVLILIVGAIDAHYDYVDSMQSAQEVVVEEHTTVFDITATVAAIVVVIFILIVWAMVFPMQPNSS